MKKIILIFILSVFTFNISAQISEGGLPPSYKSAVTKSSTALASHTMARPDTTALAAFNAGNPVPLRYAVLEDFRIDIKKNATKSVLADGSILWRYRINSPAGKSLQVIFSKYLVPEGAQLFLYNDDYSTVRGAYTDMNITDDLMFVTGDFPGKYVIIEYYEPYGVDFEGEVIIGSVGQAYIDIFSPKSGNIDEDGYIGINCDEGIPFQNQKHAVCKYTFNDGQYSYLCTGSLVNNVSNDETPYFLTASHCISTASEASTIVAYFNYEEPSCTNFTVNPTQTLSGSSLRTTGSRSDYTLIEFANPVPSSYKPYFAGWDVSDIAPGSSVCIHHPGGGRKKIALDHDPALSVESELTWEGGSVSPAGSHWAVAYDEGTTAPGSSGGPLFDQNHRITGQLHGGSTTDYFGKLSYSWLHPGGTYPTLKSFLDPEATGVMSVDGYYPEDNLPDAQFLSTFNTVCTDSPVELSGFSAFGPLEWSWSFNPSQVEYHEGTSSSSPSPKVSFLADGSYRVTLTVTNSAGYDELAIDNFITAGSDITLRAFPSGLEDSCLSSFTGLVLQAYGADAYEWALSDRSDDLFYIVNNTANPAEIKVLEGAAFTQSTDLEVTLKGIQGSCQSIIDIVIPLEAQTNDFVANAIPIAPGSSGPFSNSCASVEEGEPVPPYDSCTGQLSWCDEYGTGEDIVERSVWFTYTPEVNEIIMLTSTGFDNEIAVYRAASAEDLLSGNYTLEAANDDYSGSDYNPKISSIELTANQKYWIQVDGSGGGTTGTFFLRLSVLLAEIVPESGIRVYPQPAVDYVNFSSATFYDCSSVRVELADVAGRIILNKYLTPSAGRVQLQLGNLAKGIYMARIYCNDDVTVVKVVN